MSIKTCGILTFISKISRYMQVSEFNLYNMQDGFQAIPVRDEPAQRAMRLSDKPEETNRGRRLYKRFFMIYYRLNSKFA